MEIPINAPVKCSDGAAGRTSHVVVHPGEQRVTHLVVVDDRGDRVERLVSLEMVAEATEAGITLQCTRKQLGELPRFTQGDYTRSRESFQGYPPDAYFLLPTTIEGGIAPREALPTDQLLEQAEQRVPPGEEMLYRGAQVRATDGFVGVVEELVVTQEDGRITHVVLRNRREWGDRAFTIPVTEVARVENNTLYLRLDRQSVESLAQ